MKVLRTFSNESFYHNYETCNLSNLKIMFLNKKIKNQH